jgi:uncharacterized repeat protein (TIGR01451 family)
MRSLRTHVQFGILLTAVSLLAQGQPRLEIEIQEQKINLTRQEKNGAEIVYTPGDTIEYTVIAKNTGDAVMLEPTIVDPVPEGVEYIVGSAGGENCRIVFSVDKGLQFSTWPVMISATTPNGTKVEREARNEEVTHIKWLIRENIPAGGQKKMSFQVRVQ